MQKQQTDGCKHFDPTSFPLSVSVLACKRATTFTSWLTKNSIKSYRTNRPEGQAEGEGEGYEEDGEKAAPHGHRRRISGFVPTISSAPRPV